MQLAQHTVAFHTKDGWSFHGLKTPDQSKWIYGVYFWSMVVLMNGELDEMPTPELALEILKREAADARQRNPDAFIQVKMRLADQKVRVTWVEFGKERSLDVDQLDLMSYGLDEDCTLDLELPPCEIFRIEEQVRLRDLLERDAY